VKRRYKFAMDELMKKKNYSLVCCRKSRRGRCRSCSGTTLAYVMVGSNGTNTRFSYTDIKICPRALEMNRGYGKKHLRLGFTMFHELMHLTSGASDYGYGLDQGKRMAENRPKTARMNAQAYMYFAMDAGKGGDSGHSGGDDKAADEAAKAAERRR
jgi:hypothetical protein